MIAFYFITCCVVQFTPKENCFFQFCSPISVVCLCVKDRVKFVHISCRYKLGVCEFVINWALKKSSRERALALCVYLQKLDCDTQFDLISKKL